jgi:hypothetical protein
MIIGDPKFFTKEHFEANRGFAPGYLCELVVYCLELVSQLSRSGLKYRFKGGNSQLILLDDPRRFSIDVDIVSTVEKPHMIEVVEKITAGCELFTSCEVRVHKTKPWLPMVSFKLFFNSVYQAPEDAFVMLDAVLEEAPYGGVTMEVACLDLYRSAETVELPTISGLLADKMLCIGPDTLGIPLGKGKEAHRLKHVFDVGTLSRESVDLDEFRAALDACMEQENAMQKSSWTRPQVIEDTRKFCSEPLAYAENPPADQLEPGTYFDEISRGFEGFREVLFKENYTWQRFQDDCRQVNAMLDKIDPA